MDNKKTTTDKDSCKTCFWLSKSGYCTKGPDPPRRPKEPCNSYEALKHVSRE